MIQRVLAVVAVALATLHHTGAHGGDTDGVRPWTEYRVIMWVSDSAHKQPDKFPLFLQRLREMGATTGMVHGHGDAKPWVDNQFPYYVENMVNRGLCLKWNSKVRNWDAHVTEWSKTRTKNAFIREYCLDDPQWLDGAKNEMKTLVVRHRDKHPLAYDIRDELSITLSANPFDYDFSPATLKRFRDWLKTQYTDLAALNAQWETNFPSWDDVVPFTTDEIKNRMASGDAIPRGQPDWQALSKLRYPFPDTGTQVRRHTALNLSPWCDFRTYMDIQLARTLDTLRKTARELDPHTPVGIEGTQMPHAFGGYNLWRLSQVLDWVEPYDIAGARAIIGSFMPGKPILSTLSETDTNKARRKLWHLLLEGDKGCIIWWSEDCIDWASNDLALTPKAKALAPALKEMTGPVAQLFLRAERLYDPIAIHYSQPSIQVDWLLESTVDGRTWHRRFSSYEAQHNRMAAERVRCLQLLKNAGYTPRFVSSAQIENGYLAKYRMQLFVMPDSWAMSDREIEQIKAARCAMYHQNVAGAFDQHGTLRAQPVFAEPATNLPPIPKTVSIVTPDAQTAVYRYRLGSSAQLVAFERNLSWHATENLKEEGHHESLEKPIAIEAKLPQPAHLYDLRGGKYLGHTDTIRFTVDPWQPSVFALLPKQVAPSTIIDWLQSQAGR